MGRYISSEAVLVRLRGKVKVTDDPEQNPDRLPLLLLNRLINEAEGDVELELSTRFLAPFQTINCQPFANLPERPTKEILRTVCELLSAIRVLETDFGRGSSIDASKYADSMQKRYDAMIQRVVGIREGTFNTFKFPPLPGLKSNTQIGQADNGFAGAIHRTDGAGGLGGYPVHQINSPGENFWNGFVGAEDDHYGEDF